MRAKAVFDNCYAGVYFIYINGNLDKSQEISLSTVNADGCIGKRCYSSAYPYSGVIDEVAIFDRALSTEEVEELYDKGVSNKGYCDSPQDPPEERALPEPQTSRQVSMA